MKILITNLYLNQGTGSETFIYTLAKYLKSRGHEVHFYAFYTGDFKKKLEKEGFICIENKKIKDTLIFKTDNIIKKLYKFTKRKILLNKYLNFYLLNKLNLIKYDIIHFQHKSTVKFLYNKFKDTPNIFISHGILPSEEQVPNYNIFPMNYYLAVSEEVKFNMIKKLPKNTIIDIIRNPIDTNHYNSNIEINNKIKNILVISKKILNNKKYLNIIRNAVKKIGANAEFIGHPYKVVKDTRPFIEKADLVIGIGRCIYEAMSMGRNVIVLDYLGLDGIIDSEKTFKKLRNKNLSGRVYNNINFTEKQLINEFNKYNKLYGKLNRELIMKYNSIGSEGKKIERYYNNTIKTFNNAKNLNNNYNI